jgi:tetratricopeptide (TPR) repeat protein
MIEMKPLLLLYFILFISFSSEAQVTDESTYFLKKASYFYKYKEYDSACKYFNLSAAANPREEKAYMGIGLCCHRLGKYQEAIQPFRTAIEMNASTIENAYSGIAGAYASLNRYDSAIYFITKFIALKPQNPLAYEIRGDYYASLLKYSEAFHDYKTAIDLGRSDFELFISAGAMCVRLKDFPRAIDYYSKAIKLKPQASEGYLRRSDAYRQADMAKEAYSDIDKAIALDSTNYNCYGVKALLLYDDKKFSDCLFYCNKVLLMDTSKAEIWSKKGACEYLLEPSDPVILKDLNKAISLDDKLVEAYYYRGAYFYRNGEFQKAYTDFSKAVSLDPKNIPAKEWKDKARSKMKG